MSKQNCRHSRLSARSWDGSRWFCRSRQITFYFLLFLLAAIIRRRDVLKFSGIEGERDGALLRDAYKVSPSAIRWPTAIVLRLSNSHPSWHQTDRLYIPCESSHRVESPKHTFDAIRDIQLLHLVQKYAIQLTRRSRGLPKHVCKGDTMRNSSDRTYHRPMKIRLVPLGRICQERELRHAEDLARNVLDARLPHRTIRVRKDAQGESVVARSA